MILFQEDPNKDKLILLAVEYERWNVILMMLKLWETNLDTFGRFGDVLPRDTWEYLREALGGASLAENSSKKQRKAFESLKTLVKSVEF